MGWVFWGIVGAAVVHVVEEYLGDWVGSVQKVMPGVTLAQFVVVNAAFLALSIVSAIVGMANLVFSLSVVSLVFINALIHLGATVSMRRYSPGVASAILFYVPLAFLAYYLAARSRQLTLSSSVGAVLLGGLWMALPIGFQLVWLTLARRKR
jgi:hypothetical protein